MSTSAKSEKNVKCILLDEERLDPHGVGYLPHVLILKKSHHDQHLESEEDLSVHITDMLTEFQSILVKFQTKREQEIAVKSMLNGSRHTCTVLVLLPTAHGKSIILQTHVIASRATKQYKGVFPFSSIINDQTTKARSLGIKHVSLFFFGKSLSTTDITPVVCCHEKDLQFSQEIGAAKIHTSTEN